MDPAEFVAAGLYDPTSPDAKERLALLRWLTDRGFTAVEIAEADADPGLPLEALASQQAVRQGQIHSRRESARLLGLSDSALERMLLASGYPNGDLDEAALTDMDITALRSFVTANEIFGEEPIEQFARVISAAAAKVAEAATSLFLAEVEQPLIDDEASPVVLAQANLAAVYSLDTLPIVMEALLRSQVEIANRRARLARQDSEDTMVAIGFIDLVGFTPLSRRLDDAELSKVLDGFESRASDIATAHDGRVVKHIGDEVMFVVVDPNAACEIALEIVDAVRGLGRGVRPSGSVTYGPVLSRAGDYYGSVVNLASRVADMAVPYEILVTEELVNAAEKWSMSFVPAGRRMLKGFEEPVSLWELHRAE